MGFQFDGRTIFRWVGGSTNKLDQIGPRKESPIESTNDFRRNVPLQRCGDSGCWFLFRWVVVGVGLVDFWLVLMFLLKGRKILPFCQLMPDIFKILSNTGKYRLIPSAFGHWEAWARKFWDHVMSGAARRCEDAGTNACLMELFLSSSLKRSSTLKMLVLMASSFWRCQLVEILGFKLEYPKNPNWRADYSHIHPESSYSCSMCSRFLYCFLLVSTKNAAQPLRHLLWGHGICK